MPEARCRDFFNQLSEYIDGELAAPLCAELEQHLADCPDCQTVVLYRRFGQAEFPQEVGDRLWRVLEQAGFGSTGRV